MGPISTLAEVFDAIQKVKAGASAFCTNFFPVQGRLQGWINHGELFCDLRAQSAFFLRKDRDFWHLYFCAPDWATLQREISALPGLRAERMSVDLVGTEESLGEALRTMGSVGFRRYGRLVRLARPSQAATPQPPADGTEVACAANADCQAIINLLESSFNRYADQLPMPYEIEAAIEARQILAARCEQNLAALLFFETQGFTSTVRYWVVDQRFRSHGFGSALMRHYFTAQSAVRRFILWVTADNEGAVQKYRHYGYAPDGLVDHVLVNEAIRP